MKTVIHWFRRDFRLTDNTALNAAVAAADGRVVTVYILSRWEKTHHWAGPNRQEFLCGCLRSLAKNLETVGGRLIIRSGDAVAELEKLLLETRADAIYCNRDPDPFGWKVEGDVASDDRTPRRDLPRRKGRGPARARRTPLRHRQMLPGLFPVPALVVEDGKTAGRPDASASSRLRPRSPACPCRTSRTGDCKARARISSNPANTPPASACTASCRSPAA